MAKTQTNNSKSLFVESELYNGNLSKVSRDTITDTNLDQIAKRHGFFSITETKKFSWNEKVIIPIEQWRYLKCLGN